MPSLEKRLWNILNLARGQLLAHYLRLHRCKVGRRLKCRQVPSFRQVPRGNIQLGDSVMIGCRVTLDVAAQGRVAVGSHVNLTQDIVISAYVGVEIGPFVQVAEFVSIRDSDHGIDKHRHIGEQPHKSLPIKIGKDVWLGAGVRILKGALVPDGVVIGANSVVSEGSPLEPHGIYAGAPVRHLGDR